MSISSQNEPSEGWWSSVRPSIEKPVAAASAIVYPFRDFMKKSEQQLGKPNPQISVREGLLEGVKAAPIIGMTIGMQIVSQGFVEKRVKWILPDQEEKENVSAMLLSSAIVGFVSSPFLAVFNGLSMKRGIVESLKKFSIAQAFAITARETAFLFSLRIIDPITEVMKQVFGDNKAVEYSSAFISGGVGSVVGHSFDTALTRMQKDLLLQFSAQQLMRGSVAKAAGTAKFALLYTIAKELLCTKLEE